MSIISFDLDRETCRRWGGKYANGKCKPSFFNEKYKEKTTVRNCKDALQAFKKYTDYFNYVKQQPRKNNKALFLPCAAKKPIGIAGDARKKIDAIESLGIDDYFDVLILSEPATVIPNNERLLEPAINYDFPPKYAKKENCPRVFEVFTDRLAEFLELRNYDKVFTYLIKHHNCIFQEGMNKASVGTMVEEVPSSSYSEKAGRRISDRFATLEQIQKKLKNQLGGNHA